MPIRAYYTLKALDIKHKLAFSPFFGEVIKGTNEICGPEITASYGNN
jgi:hypothetical protein